MHCELPHRASLPLRLLRKLFLAGFVTVLGAGSEGTARAEFGYVQYYTFQEPKIMEHPESQLLEQGQTAMLKVKLEPLKKGHTYSRSLDEQEIATFQWVKNGARINGATTDTLTITNAQPSHSGAYQVVIEDKHVSQTATLTVYIPVPATILTQPMGATVTSGQTATFTVAAGGTPAPTFRWRKHGLPIAGATTATLTFTDPQWADAGNYDVLVVNNRNSVLSRTVQLRIIATHETASLTPDSATLPARTSDAHVMTMHREVGDSAAFTMSAADSSATHQWKRYGQPLLGATKTILTLPAVSAADMGFYSITSTRNGATSETLNAMLVVATNGSSRLANLSTRGFIPAGAALTPGFTLRGNGSARLLVRAIGPTLGRFGVGEAHRDPALEIISAGAMQPMLSNDNWATAPNVLDVHATTAAVGAFALDTSAKDAAVVAGFASERSYTTRITGMESTSSGVVLAEIYDPAGANQSVRLAAVSTLGHVGTGDRTLVSGFTISGAAPKRLLVRAVGPGLSAFGVRDALADPQLVLAPAGFDATIASNDNWQGDASIAATARSTGAFPLAPDSRDAAIEVTLPPGGYTITVSSRDGTTGSALVEIYDLDR